MKSKEELLKIYSSYLPYELNGVADFLLDTVFIVDKMSFIKVYGKTKFGNNVPIGCLMNEFMPILYSMDYLTKEIEHKGERFIPTVKLRFSTQEEMLLKAWGSDSGRLTYNQSQKLLEYHFNIFGLSDSEYIKKETLK